MEKCAIFHKSKSNYAYAYDHETLHIRLRTKKEDVNSVKLLFGDPYDYVSGKTSESLAAPEFNWNVMEIPMFKSGADELFDFWFVQIKPKWRRLRYAFLLQNQDEKVLYGERDICDIKGLADFALTDQKNFFVFPFLNSVDVYHGPDWVKDTIWYQIFPERFANGDASNDNENVKLWGSPIEKRNDFYGGDLQGIIDHLDYLEELGVNGIYLTPVFHSPSNHKYDTIDYFNIDPHFGSNELMKLLIDLCHKKGIKVMFDVVFNHCGFYSKQFQDVLTNGESSIFKDWFHIKKFPVSGEHDLLNNLTYFEKELNFDTFAFTPMMPKLNTENEEVKKMLLSVVEFWGENYHVDGWRLDVANEVDHSFWREFRKSVKEINKDCYILGEIWHDAYSWLKGDQFDAVMNYPLNSAVVDFFARGTMDAETFESAVNHANFMYPENVNEQLYNLLDSHDTTRFMCLADENIERLKLAYLFMFTIKGAPSIYYGNEIGMTGEQDPDNRRCMIWDPSKQDLKMFRFMQKLIQIRKQNSVLRNEGEFEWLMAQKGSRVLIYRRFTDHKSYDVLMNNSNSPIECPLPKVLQHQKAIDLLMNQEILLKESISLKAYQYLLLERSL